MQWRGTEVRNWRKISIALKIPEKGEWKAQTWRTPGFNNYDCGKMYLQLRS